MSESWAPGWPASLDGFWSWQARGACQDTDTRLFFSPDGERAPARQTREQQAKAICARCLVVDVCAAYAVTAPEWYGVWGGLSEADRRRIRQHTGQADQGWRSRHALVAWETTSASEVRGASGAG
jgi:WhiB family redox-sensing transcriptional regulator